MAQRRFHYEQAFEHYLRANRVPYIAVDEARKSLLPDSADLPAVKSFDFVVYAPGRNLLVDVKGRMYGSNALNKRGTPSNRRLESWVTNDDVDGLRCWQRLFGSEFDAVFVFMYCLRQQPPDALFEQVFCYNQRWYALREIELEAYCRLMRTRSRRWKTVDLDRADFDRQSRPFALEDRTPPAVPRSTRRMSRPATI